MLRRTLLLLMILAATSLVIFAHGNEPDGHHDENAPKITLDFTPTYYEHVKPIIAANCIACHQEGQIAWDISLADATNLEFPDDLAFVTSTRYMPPWMPSKDSLPMKHDRSLTDYEVAVIQAWVNANAPAGDPASYVEPAATYALTDIRDDQIIRIDEPYMPDNGVDDDYRCFTFSPNIDEPMFLTGYEFLPDVAEMVHHGILYKLSGAAQSQIDLRNFADGRIGWSCYTGTGIRASDEFVGTWTPGTLPLTFPEGTGYWVEPDDIFVLQIHYNLLAVREPDQTAVKLQYTEAEADLRHLMTVELSAPVEIPCPTGVTGEQCERRTAIDRAATLYGDNWINYRPDGLLQECGQTIADYADSVGENASTYCDFDIPGVVTVWGVFGHMHELGTQFQLEINPDTDRSLMVLDIPRWDFHWQDRYQLEEPLRLSFRDSVRMRCTWDNTLSDNPRYVVWGEGTEDEMCFATIMLSVP